MESQPCQRISFLSFSLFLLLIYPTFASAGATKLPQTGQTTCYSSTGAVIPCSGTGQDGDVRAGIPWPNPRFTDNGNRTMMDNLTGLIWTKDGNTPGPAACGPRTTKTWQGAFDYVKCLNKNNFLEYNDWRLPNVNELDSLVNAESCHTPAWLNAAGFSNVQDNNYWSSNSDACYPDRGWIISMWSGRVLSANKSNSYFYAWPVRAAPNNSKVQLPQTGQTTCYSSTGAVISCAGTGQDGDVRAGIPWPNPRFTDNGNRTVMDNLTGLIWTKDGNAPGPAACGPRTAKTWEGAFDYVKCLNKNNFLEYNDWRLPNRRELRSLLNYEQFRTDNWLDSEGFSIKASYYWSSSVYAYFTSHAWVMNTWHGHVYSDIRSNYHCVWPVRAGQLSH